MQKPRPYSGRVAWLDEARAIAETWSDVTLLRVIERFPYPPERGIRRSDWVELVAHVASTRGDDVAGTAERLALYVTTYRERHQTFLTPEKILETQ